MREHDPLGPWTQVRSQQQSKGTVTGLTPGKVYAFRVRALGPNGEGAVEQVLTAIWDNTPAKVNHVDPLDPGVATTDYDPVQMQEVINKVNELILALWRA